MQRSAPRSRPFARRSTASASKASASSASEQFVEDGGRSAACWWSALAWASRRGTLPKSSAERRSPQLLTSGEKKAVIDLSGLGYDADAAARVGFGAALRAWRYDRYRTKLKDKQKPTLEEIVIVGAGEGAASATSSAGRRWSKASP